MLDAFNAKMDEAFQASQTFRPNKADWLEGHWSGLKAAGPGENEEERLDATAVPLDALQLSRLYSVATPAPVAL